MNSDDHYICFACGGKFQFEHVEWGHAAALAEKEHDYPDVPMDECVRVCDGCYNKFNLWADQTGVRSKPQ